MEIHRTARDPLTAIRKLAARSAVPALLGVLAVAFLLNLLNLAAAAYEWRAEQHLDALPDATAERASAMAAALTPWSPSRQALKGWVRASNGDAEAAVDAYLRALRAAPTDALLWVELALALSRNRIFDFRLGHATLCALALAPASPAVRRSVSQMGLSYWRHGSPEVREAWRQSMRWELDHNRAAFLQFLQDEGGRREFCRRHAEELGEQAWCSGGPGAPP